MLEHSELFLTKKYSYMTDTNVKKGSDKTKPTREKNVVANATGYKEVNLTGFMAKVLNYGRS
jgi:hypothetical protein